MRIRKIKRKKVRQSQDKFQFIQMTLLQRSAKISQMECSQQHKLLIRQHQENISVKNQIQNIPFSIKLQHHLFQLKKTQRKIKQS